MVDSMSNVTKPTSKGNLMGQLISDEARFLVMRGDYSEADIIQASVSCVLMLKAQRILLPALAITSAGTKSVQLVGRKAKVDFDGSLQGWTPEFSEWYRKRREVYLKEARDQLNEEATNDEIDEEIENELEAWND
jgi:hypothetical protein